MSSTIAKGGRGLVHEAPGGSSEEWYTPAWVFEALGLTFDLDPCHPEGDRLPWVPTRDVLTKRDDGLATPWPEGASVFLNPPYGDQVPAWLAKQVAQRRGVALLFARSDTDWFHRLAVTANAMLFVAGRIRFVDRSGQPPRDAKGRIKGPGVGSMLLAWGPDMVAGLERWERTRGGLLVKGRAVA